MSCRILQLGGRRSRKTEWRTNVIARPASAQRAFVCTWRFTSAVGLEGEFRVWFKTWARLITL